MAHGRFTKKPVKTEIDRYSVVVGNVGTVYSGGSFKKAHKEFVDWKAVSKSGHGRAGGENVTLFIDGDISYEYLSGKDKS